MKTEEAVRHARESAKKRNFKQSFDLSINITGLNLKSPESRISKEVVLPHGRGKKPKLCLISDSMKYENRMTKAEMEALAKNKAAVKRIVREYDFFMSEPSLMVAVGKTLGRYLGPPGKMPKVVPPGADMDKISQQISKSTRVRIKDSPVIHCVVGAEDMDDKQVAENVASVLNDVRTSLPGKGQIRNAFVKLTMGKAVKIDI